MNHVQYSIFEFLAIHQLSTSKSYYQLEVFQFQVFSYDDSEVISVVDSFGETAFCPEGFGKEYFHDFICGLVSGGILDVVVGVFVASAISVCIVLDIESVWDEDISESGCKAGFTGSIEDLNGCFFLKESGMIEEDFYESLDLGIGFSDGNQNESSTIDFPIRSVEEASDIYDVIVFENGHGESILVEILSEFCECDELGNAEIAFDMF